MPAKLQIPTRVQGQDDAQYAQAVRESIKSQRPYLSDDEIQSLSSFEVTNAPKVASPTKGVAPKVATAIQSEKPQPFKSTTEMVDKFVPKQEEPKLELADPNKAAATARMLDKFIPTQPKEAPMELVGKYFAPEAPKQASILNKIAPNVQQVTENAPIQVQPSSGKA